MADIVKHYQDLFDSMEKLSNVSYVGDRLGSKFLVRALDSSGFKVKTLFQLHGLEQDSTLESFFQSQIDTYKRVGSKHVGSFDKLTVSRIFSDGNKVALEARLKSTVSGRSFDLPLNLPVEVLPGFATKSSGLAAGTGQFAMYGIPADFFSEFGTAISPGGLKPDAAGSQALLYQNLAQSTAAKLKFAMMSPSQLSEVLEMPAGHGFISDFAVAAKKSIKYTIEGGIADREKVSNLLEYAQRSFAPGSVVFERVDDFDRADVTFFGAIGSSSRRMMSDMTKINIAVSNPGALNQLMEGITAVPKGGVLSGAYSITEFVDKSVTAAAVNPLDPLLESSGRLKTLSISEKLLSVSVNLLVGSPDTLKSLKVAPDPNQLSRIITDGIVKFTHRLTINEDGKSLGYKGKNVAIQKIVESFTKSEVDIMIRAMGSITDPRSTPSRIQDLAVFMSDLSGELKDSRINVSLEGFSNILDYRTRNLLSSGISRALNIDDKGNTRKIGKTRVTRAAKVGDIVRLTSNGMRLHVPDSAPHHLKELVNVRNTFQDVIRRLNIGEITEEQASRKIESVLFKGETLMYKTTEANLRGRSMMDLTVLQQAASVSFGEGAKGFKVIRPGNKTATLTPFMHEVYQARGMEFIGAYGQESHGGLFQYGTAMAGDVVKGNHFTQSHTVDPLFNTGYASPFGFLNTTPKTATQTIGFYEMPDAWITDDTGGLVQKSMPAAPQAQNYYSKMLSAAPKLDSVVSPGSVRFMFPVNLGTSFLDNSEMAEAVRRKSLTSFVVVDNSGIWGDTSRVKRIKGEVSWGSGRIGSEINPYSFSFTDSMLTNIRDWSKRVTSDAIMVSHNGQQIALHDFIDETLNLVNKDVGEGVNPRKEIGGRFRSIMSAMDPFTMSNISETLDIRMGEEVGRIYSVSADGSLSLTRKPSPLLSESHYPIRPGSIPSKIIFRGFQRSLTSGSETFHFMGEHIHKGINKIAFGVSSSSKTSAALMESNVFATSPALPGSKIDILGITSPEGKKDASVLFEQLQNQLAFRTAVSTSVYAENLDVGLERNFISYLDDIQTAMISEGSPAELAVYRYGSSASTRWSSMQDNEKLDFSRRYIKELQSYRSKHNIQKGTYGVLTATGDEYPARVYAAAKQILTNEESVSGIFKSINTALENVLSSRVGTGDHLAFLSSTASFGATLHPIVDGIDNLSPSMLPNTTIGIASMFIQEAEHTKTATRKKSISYNTIAGFFSSIADFSYEDQKFNRFTPDEYKGAIGELVKAGQFEVDVASARKFEFLRSLYMGSDPTNLVSPIDSAIISNPLKSQAIVKNLLIDFDMIDNITEEQIRNSIFGFDAQRKILGESGILEGPISGYPTRAMGTESISKMGHTGLVVDIDPKRVISEAVESIKAISGMGRQELYSTVESMFIRRVGQEKWSSMGSYKADKYIESAVSFIKGISKRFEDEAFVTDLINREFDYHFANLENNMVVNRKPLRSSVLTPPIMKVFIPSVDSTDLDSADGIFFKDPQGSIKPGKTARNLMRILSLSNPETLVDNILGEAISWVGSMPLSGVQPGHVTIQHLRSQTPTGDILSGIKKDNYYLDKGSSYYEHIFRLRQGGDEVAYIPRIADGMSRGFLLDVPAEDEKSAWPAYRKGRDIADAFLKGIFNHGMTSDQSITLDILKSGNQQVGSVLTPDSNTDVISRSIEQLNAEAYKSTSERGPRGQTFGKLKSPTGARPGILKSISDIHASLHNEVETLINSAFENGMRRFKAPSSGNYNMMAATVLAKNVADRISATLSAQIGASMGLGNLKMNIGVVVPDSATVAMNPNDVLQIGLPKSVMSEVLSQVSGNPDEARFIREQIDKGIIPEEFSSHFSKAFGHAIGARNPQFSRTSASLAGIALIPEVNPGIMGVTSHLVENIWLGDTDGDTLYMFSSIADAIKNSKSDNPVIQQMKRNLNNPSSMISAIQDATLVDDDSRARSIERLFGYLREGDTDLVPVEMFGREYKVSKEGFNLISQMRSGFLSGMPMANVGTQAGKYSSVTSSLLMAISNSTVSQVRRFSQKLNRSLDLLMDIQGLSGDQAEVVKQAHGVLGQIIHQYGGQVTESRIGAKNRIIPVLGEIAAALRLGLTGIPIDSSYPVSVQQAKTMEGLRKSGSLSGPIGDFLSEFGKDPSSMYKGLRALVGATRDINALSESEVTSEVAILLKQISERASGKSIGTVAVNTEILDQMEHMISSYRIQVNKGSINIPMEDLVRVITTADTFLLRKEIAKSVGVASRVQESILSGIGDPQGYKTLDSFLDSNQSVIDQSRALKKWFGQEYFSPQRMASGGDLFNLLSSESIESSTDMRIYNLSSVRNLYDSYIEEKSFVDNYLEKKILAISRLGGERDGELVINPRFESAEGIVASKAKVQAILNDPETADLIVRNIAEKSGDDVDKIREQLTSYIEPGNDSGNLAKVMADPNISSARKTTAILSMVLAKSASSEHFAEFFGMGSLSELTKHSMRTPTKDELITIFRDVLKGLIDPSSKEFDSVISAYADAVPQRFDSLREIAPALNQIKKVPNVSQNVISEFSENIGFGVVDDLAPESFESKIITIQYENVIHDINQKIAKTDAYKMLDVISEEVKSQFIEAESTASQPKSVSGIKVSGYHLSQLEVGVDVSPHQLASAYIERYGGIKDTIMVEDHVDIESYRKYLSEDLGLNEYQVNQKIAQAEISNNLSQETIDKAGEARVLRRSEYYNEVIERGPRVTDTFLMDLEMDPDSGYHVVKNIAPEKGRAASGVNVDYGSPSKFFDDAVGTIKKSPRAGVVGAAIAAAIPILSATGRKISETASESVGRSLVAPKPTPAVISKVPSIPESPRQSVSSSAPPASPPVSPSGPQGINHVPESPSSPGMENLDTQSAATNSPVNQASFQGMSPIRPNQGTARISMNGANSGGRNYHIRSRGDIRKTQAALAVSIAAIGAIGYSSEGDVRWKEAQSAYFREHRKQQAIEDAYKR